MAIRDARRSIFCDPTGPAQFMMMPKVEFSQYGINILRVVKFIFKSVDSCKHNMHENCINSEQQNKYVLYFKNKSIFSSRQK